MFECAICHSKLNKVQMSEGIHKVKGKEIRVKSFRRVCLNCNAVIIDPQFECNIQKLINKEYASLYGITAEEIKEIRDKAEISQETLAKIIGCARKTITSYEQGNSLPSDTHFTILRSLVRNPKLLQEFARINEDKLSKREKRIIFGNILFDSDIDKISKTARKKYIKENSRLVNLISYFSRSGISKPSLDKAIYYLDFYNKKLLCKSSLGQKYALIKTPKKLSDLLNELEEKNIIKIVTESRNTEAVVDKIYSIHNFSSSPFTDEEYKVLETVYNLVIK